jgi:hypothetical protein
MQELRLWIPEEGLTMTAMCAEVGRNLYRVGSIPVATEAFAYGDVIETEPADGKVRVRRVAERKGWRTFVFLLSLETPEPEALPRVLLKVEQLGGVWERTFGGILAISLPPTQSYDPSAEIRAGGSSRGASRPAADAAPANFSESRRCMDPWVEALMALVPPPRAPHEVPPPEQWALAESRMGIAIPQDFREIVTAYGTGALDGFLILLNPSSSRSHLDLLQYDADMEMIRLVCNRARELTGAERLVPIGYTINGDEIFYAIEDRVPTSILLVEGRGGDCERHRMPLAEWLVGMMRGTLRIRMFPSNVPSATPWFQSFG